MANTFPQLLQNDNRSLARCISAIENEQDGYQHLLQSLPVKNTPVIGITGPPGAGKSSLIAALTKLCVEQQKHIAIIAVDPSSPFNKGAIMGDRIRMSEHFLHPNVYIRSMATRGSLGGLAPKIVEVTDLVKAAWFDYIFIETVGVGQSEVEIAALADTTIVTLVPEAGDDIQTIKSGLMEVADIFVVNKADRDGAATLFKNLKSIAHANATVDWETPVVRTSVTKNEGIPELLAAIQSHSDVQKTTSRKAILLAERAMTLIKNNRTKDISFHKILKDVEAGLTAQNFNLYLYVSKYTNA